MMRPRVGTAWPSNAGDCPDPARISLLMAVTLAATRYPEPPKRQRASKAHEGTAIKDRALAYQTSHTTAASLFRDHPANSRNGRPDHLPLKRFFASSVAGM